MFSRLVCVLALLLSVSFAGLAQILTVNRIDPPNWWVGMKWNRVQLMIYGENLDGVAVDSDAPGVRIHAAFGSDNPSYVFIDLEISDSAAPGVHTLRLRKNKEIAHIAFPILQRKSPAGRYQGFDQHDVIYLITPDRFSNGDTTNDEVEGMLERPNRDHPYGRHGGDLRGIINALDYLGDLGVTALWINPLVENNGAANSYHGYATTDLYRIDPRFGTNELYTELVAEAHARGLMIIMDHVNNHIGINHPWVKNLPMQNWLNGTVKDHRKAYHGKIELTDIHSDSAVKVMATLGWFSDYMPDLNQQNPFVSTYLIQNTLWWVESTGLDGIREDTYPYVDQKYMSEWARAILTEYPHFKIVGEVWIPDPVYLAPYQKGSHFPSFDSHLPSVTDFGLFDAFCQVFEENRSITTVYDCLTKDFLFPNPYHLVTFLDNHDIKRIAYGVNGDTRRFKLALSLLLTTRGIPQIYYGTEIAMMGGKDHGTIRSNFPGGFPGDVRNAFTSKGRTDQEKDIYEYLKQMLKLRRTHRALAYGKLIHFSPVNEVYVYFRISDEENIMVAINNNVGKEKVNLSRFAHLLKDAGSLRNLESGVNIDLHSETLLEIDGMDAEMYVVADGRN